MDDPDSPLWESTPVQNLIRYRPSGTYFARFKVGGKLIRQSLETAVFSVAKLRLPDKIREHRSHNESVKAFASGKMTVSDAARAYLEKVDASASLKPRSKAYNRMLFDFIKRSWPARVERRPRVRARASKMFDRHSGRPLESLRVEQKWNSKKNYLCHDPCKSLSVRSAPVKTRTSNLLIRSEAKK